MATRNSQSPTLTPAAGTPHDAAAPRQALMALARQWATAQARVDHAAEQRAEGEEDEARSDLRPVLI